MSLQQENNDLHEKLTSSRVKISSLEKEKQQLSGEIKCTKELASALKAEKTAMLEKSNAQKKKLNVLEARTKQLQFGVQQNTDHIIQHKTKQQVKDESSDEGVFEVQKLLAHKIAKKKRHFLVRWKGYDSIEDSWVPESALNCPKILNSYLKSKNIE